MDKPLYIVGNWKSNKTVEQSLSWITDFTALWQKQPINNEKIKVILCPSFIHLVPLAKAIVHTNILLLLGSQNLSQFEAGAFTGEISASMLSGWVKYSLVGHSERRRHFNETDSVLQNKVNAALSAGIIPVYCVQSVETPFPQNCPIIAYEPVWAIGTGKPDTAENANSVAKSLKSRAKNPVSVIYGGSVSEKNVASFVSQPDIDGVLPGGASLDPVQFMNLIVSASQVVK